MDALFSPSERNVFGYLSRAFDTFVERPLSDVDSLVLSCVSYFRVPRELGGAWEGDGVSLRELFRAEYAGEMTHGLWDPEGLSRLLALLAASPRFRDVVMRDHVDDFSVAEDKQFSACTLDLPGGGSYVSFRGTDNTLVGWREDFNMAFETGVPSQLAATAYLERAARRAEGPLWAGGHSKGGNLAVYAACTCDASAAAKLERVFSHDGPGFTRETLASAGWRERSDLVSKTVPRSSLIGMLFEQQEEYAVVDSSVMGVAQHDPFSWVVDGDAFAPVEGLGRGAGFVDEKLNQWISSMTREEREGFVGALFSVLVAGGKDTFADLGESWQTAVPAMLRELGGLPPERREHITRALSLLVRAAVPGIELPQLPQMPGFEPPQFPDLVALLPGRMGSEETSPTTGG